MSALGVHVETSTRKGNLFLKAPMVCMLLKFGANADGAGVFLLSRLDFVLVRESSTEGRWC